MAFRQGTLDSNACLYQFYEEHGASFENSRCVSIEYETILNATYNISQVSLATVVRCDNYCTVIRGTVHRR